MWELDYKESWVPKNWCFWTVVLEKTLENPLDCKEVQPVDPKGNQSWIFIGRTDAEAETPIIWPPDVKNWPFEKTLMLGKIEGRRRRARQGWDRWKASPTQWTWVWVNSGIYWWTGRPGVLQSMGSQRVPQDWVIELKWTGAVFPPCSLTWGQTMAGIIAIITRPPSKGLTPVLLAPSTAVFSGPDPAAGHYCPCLL